MRLTVTPKPQLPLFRVHSEATVSFLKVDRSSVHSIPFIIALCNYSAWNTSISYFSFRRIAWWIWILFSVWHFDVIKNTRDFKSVRRFENKSLSLLSNYHDILKPICDALEGLYLISPTLTAFSGFINCSLIKALQVNR